MQCGEKQADFMKTFFLTFLFILLFPISVFAYPIDAKSIYHDIGIGDTTTNLILATSTRTILGIESRNSVTSDTLYVYCGETEIFDTASNSVVNSYPSFYCADAIKARKTGTQIANLTITYVNYNLASSTSTSTSMTATSSQIDFITFTSDGAGGGTYFIPAIDFYLIATILFFVIVTISLVILFYRK